MKLNHRQKQRKKNKNPKNDDYKNINLITLC
jgi:hypothetical protein